MPKAQQKFEIKLVLNAKEALWLKTVMQNPVGPEGSEDFNMRKAFFDALPGIQELQAARADN